MSKLSLNGYVYDEALRKYFRITPNHDGSPSSSRYSSDAIKRQAEVDADFERIWNFRQLQQDTTIQRSKVLQHSLGGAVALTRELGYQQPSTYHDLSSACSSWARGLGLNTYFLKPEGSIDKFVHNAANDNLVCAMHPSTPHAGAKLQQWNARSTHWNGLGPNLLNSQISSLSLSPDHRVLLATTLGNFRPRQTLLRWMNGSQFFTIFDESAGGPTWCSAASPWMSHGSIDFATGAEDYVCHIRIGNDKISPTRLPINETHTGAHAVDWLDDTVIIGGFRNGHVFLWDTRVSGSGATSHRITHGSSICHTRALNRNQVIVAGMENLLHTYDIRSLGSPSTETRPTKPYLTFPSYRNTAHNSEAIGFDIAPTLNLVAAATDDCRLLLFNARTGQEVQLAEDGTGIAERAREMYGMSRQPEPQSGVLGDSSVGVAKCVRFVYAEGLRSEGRVPKLVAVASDVLQEWTW